MSKTSSSYRSAPLGFTKSKVIRLDTEEEPEWFFDPEEEKLPDFFDLKCHVRIGSRIPEPFPESRGSTLSFNRTHLCGLFHRVIFGGFSRMDRLSREWDIIDLNQL